MKFDCIFQIYCVIINDLIKQLIYIATIDEQFYKQYFTTYR